MYAAWGAFLSAIAAPIVKKVLAILGFGVVTWTGLQALRDQLQSTIQGLFSGLPDPVYQVLALAGMVDMVGIWLGAITTVIGIASLKQLAMLGAMT